MLFNGIIHTHWLKMVLHQIAWLSNIYLKMQYNNNKHKTDCTKYKNQMIIITLSISQWKQNTCALINLLCFHLTVGKILWYQ